ncbi:unannotated protein [freshwater metagenome]|uniref:Unannotated protein n=1 Tax=freshwater metagenome TaxID=449393 RepID=A0A6J7BPL9_9ZZZZ
MGGAEAIRPGVATTEDHHVLARDVDRGELDIPFLHPVGTGEELHGLMHTGQLTTGHGQIAPVGSTYRDHNCVVTATEVCTRDIGAHVDTGAELHALGHHLLETAVEMPLLHLELGDAVAEEAADAIGTLEHRDRVTGASELLRGRETCGA